MATRHRERCSASLVIREMPIRTPTRHFTPMRTAVIPSEREGAETREPLYVATGSVTGCSHCGKKAVWQFLKKLHRITL